MTFDDAMKRVGVDDVGQRAWVVSQLDVVVVPALASRAHPVVFWIPPSQEYVAVGVKVETRVGGRELVHWNRLACVYRTRVSFPHRDAIEVDYNFETVYRWRSARFPGPHEEGPGPPRNDPRRCAPDASCSYLPLVPATSATDRRSSAAGQLTVHTLAAVTQMEADLVREHSRRPRGPLRLVR